MKKTNYSGFFIIVILFWTLSRGALCAASVFVITNIEKFTHLQNFTFLYSIAWVDVSFGVLSLILGYLFIFKIKSGITLFNISILLATISQSYLAYTHFYIHYALDIKNISQGIGKTVMIILQLFVVFLLNKERRKGLNK